MLATTTNENPNSRHAIGDSALLSEAGGIRAKGESSWSDPIKADLIHIVKAQRLGGAENAVETQEFMALEDQFRMISLIFDNANEGIMLLDASGSIRYVNPAMCSTTGYSVGELVGKTPSILKPGGQKEDFCAGAREILGEIGKWRGRIWSKRKSGDIYPTWLSISSVLDSAGKTTQYMGISVDMSDLSDNGALTGMSSAMAGLMSF
ncbi:MAG: PAS domain S-box protein [Nitrospinae bacterium]|nr:PAS domain S-box protein [Nitrospinota bacterium]MBF0634398.1 PAS domain S-box protein [Nitrospinota bacterium]